MFKRLFVLALLLFMTAMVLAQESTPEPEATPDAESTALAEATAEATEMSDDEAMCPALVANAIDLTENNCGEAGTNEACYGYIFIDAQFRAPDAQFIEPGDIEDVINIQSLQLSPMDVESGQWGVIVMSVEAKANLVEDGTLPEDDVQIILYGDTQLSDASQFVEVTAISAVNIREKPRSNGRILGSLAADETLIANGRLPDNTWFRVRINVEGDESIGWISAEFLDTSFDPETLPIITAAEAEEAPDDIAAQYGPMQAFIFESGENDAPCSAAPNSGMLIQTPDGVASVTIWLDEVVIQLDGTGVISAQADGELTVAVVEGTAQVEANGGTSTAVAGQAIDVPLDSDLSPSAEPGAPRPVDASEVQAIPTDLLDDPVTIPVIGETPVLGTASAGFQWQFTYTTEAPYICSDGTEVTLNSAGINPTISAEADAVLISGLRFPQVSDGVYHASYSSSEGYIVQDTIQIVSSDRITGERVIDFNNPICTLTVSFTIQLTSQ